MDWKGPTDLLIRLLNSAEANCPVSYHSNCGSNQSNCSVCRMVADQGTLDRLLELWHRAPLMAEWDEPLLRFSWDVELSTLSILGTDGVPERRPIA